MDCHKPASYLKLFPRPNLPWDTDLLIYFHKLRHHFIAPRIAGLHMCPRQLLRTEVSAVAKIWSGLACAVSVVWSIQASIFFFFPSIVPEVYVPLKRRTNRRPILCLVPLFSITMTLLRCRTSTLLCNRSYLRRIRRLAYQIYHNPILSELKVAPWKVRAYLFGETALILFFLANTAANHLSFEPDGLKSPIFVAAILENNLYVSIFVHVACYVFVLSFEIALPLLRMTVKEFEAAAKTRKIVKLQEAITCFETCCSLIETIDEIASFFLGATLILTVPLIAIVFSSWHVFSPSIMNTLHVISYILSQTACTASFMFLASTIHQELHKPDEILSARVYRDEDFNDLSTQFKRRFRSSDFGYTFFGFFSFKKQTILSVINITTTYLIVALQMTSV